MPMPALMGEIFHRIRSSAFVRSSFVYLVGSVMNSALPMLLLPVLTRYLTPTDYGIIATSTVLVQMFTIVLGLNAFGLISRAHFDHDAKAQQRLVSTSISLALILSGFLWVLILPSSNFLESVTKFPASWTSVLILIALISTIQTTYLSLIQARDEPRRYVRLQIVSTTLNLMLSIFFVVAIGMDWRGRMLAIIISGVIIALISLHGLASRLNLLRFSFDKSSLRSLFSFGVPLIPHFIGGWVMTMVARLYLNHLATVADTGLYSVAFSIASPIALIVGAANQAYVPALFSKLSNSVTPDKLRLARILLLGAAALPVLAVFYGVAAYWFLPLLVGPRFHGAAAYVFWLGLGFAVQGVYFIFGNLVVFSKRTSLMSWRADFLGGLAMLVVCPVLIHFNGPIGAAQATAIAFAVSCVGCFTASRVAYPMPWREALFSIMAVSRTFTIQKKPLVVTKAGSEV